MKITVFTTSLSGTGVGRVTLALAEGLHQRGHKVELVLLSKNVSYNILHIDKIPIIHLNCSRHSTSYIPFLFYIKRARPNVIISALDIPNIMSVWCARLTRPSPIVLVSQHNIDRFMFSTEKLIKYQFLQKVLHHSFQLADGIVAVSNGVARHIEQLKLIDKQKIHVIYNGLNLQQIWLDSRQKYNEWLINGQVPTILSIGRLDENKDMQCVIKAFCRVRKQLECNLLILGEGDQRPQLEELCRSIGYQMHVKMPGFVSNPFPYLARASVFVLCSKKEALGNVIIEALALGIPVVSADSEGGGPREILEGGRYGPLVPVGDPEALAEAIVHTLDAPLPPEVLKGRAEVFSIDAMADAYLRVLSGENP